MIDWLLYKVFINFAMNRGVKLIQTSAPETPKEKILVISKGSIIPTLGRLHRLSTGCSLYLKCSPSRYEHRGHFPHHLGFCLNCTPSERPSLNTQSNLLVTLPHNLFYFYHGIYHYLLLFFFVISGTHEES